MSRVFISEGTGAGIYVFSDDHCPAHIGKDRLLSKPVPSAKQIAEAEYEPANEQVHVIFQDGTRVQVKL